VTKTASFEKEIYAAKNKHYEVFKESKRERTNSRIDLQSLYKKRLEEKNKWGLDLALFSYPLRVKPDGLTPEEAE